MSPKWRITNGNSKTGKKFFKLISIRINFKSKKNCALCIFLRKPKKFNSWNNWLGIRNFIGSIKAPFQSLKKYEESGSLSEGG